MSLLVNHHRVRAPPPFCKSRTSKPDNMGKSVQPQYHHRGGTPSTTTLRPPPRHSTTRYHHRRRKEWNFRSVWILAFSRILRKRKMNYGVDDFNIFSHFPQHLSWRHGVVQEVQEELGFFRHHVPLARVPIFVRGHQRWWCFAVFQPESTILQWVHQQHQQFIETFRDKRR